MRLVDPKERHCEGLVQLSDRFAQEAEWAGEIPIGRISDRSIAYNLLFGPDLVCGLVAETESGQVAGYAGVYRHDEITYLSILIDKGHRRSGLGTKLIQTIFDRLPENLRVEAWVGEFNTASLAAMPRFGFDPDRIEQHGKHMVHIFTRQS